MENSIIERLELIESRLIQISRMSDLKLVVEYLMSCSTHLSDIGLEPDLSKGELDEFGRLTRLVGIHVLYIQNSIRRQQQE